MALDSHSRTVAVKRSLSAIFITSFIAQNAVALPYVKERGPKSVLDFFVGDIYRTTPGRFAMIDLIFVVIGFHTWAYTEARRLGIVRWWTASFALTFGVGIATAIPFFLLARQRAIEATDSRSSVDTASR